jgi:DNA-binding MarR family transcriptional regulator
MAAQGFVAREGVHVSDRNLAGASALGPAGVRRRARSSDAPVMLGPLTGHLGYLIRRAQLWIFQDFIRTLAALDIRPAQYSVLLVIEANPGLTQMALSHALTIERARLVHVLNALEARGLVRRVASPTDRRSHALHLTADGRKMLVRIKALAAEHEGHVAQRLGPKQHKALLRLLAPFASG